MFPWGVSYLISFISKNHLLPPVAFKPVSSRGSVCCLRMPCFQSSSSSSLHAGHTASQLSACPPAFLLLLSVIMGSPLLVLLRYKQQIKLCMFKKWSNVSRVGWIIISKVLRNIKHTVCDANHSNICILGFHRKTSPTHYVPGNLPSSRCPSVSFTIIDFTQWDCTVV